MKLRGLDPRTKIILLFIVSFAIYSFSPNFVIISYIVIGLSLFLLRHEYKRVLIHILLYIFFQLIVYLYLKYQLKFLAVIMALPRFY